MLTEIKLKALRPRDTLYRVADAWLTLLRAPGLGATQLRVLDSFLIIAC